MAKPMLPLADLYPRLTSFANLHAAARRAQRAKRYRPAVLAFNARLEAELFALQEELRTFRYQQPHGLWSGPMACRSATSPASSSPIFTSTTSTIASPP